jgi:hypothetical protein
MRISVAVALTTALTLSACGGNSEAEDYQETSVDQVRKDAEKAMTGLKSVRVAGDMTTQGQTIGVDVALAEDGTCEGTMDVDKAGSIDVLVVDEKGYVKADQEFWASQLGPQGPAVAKQIGDKWVAAKGGVEQMLSFCSFEGFVSGLAQAEEDSWKEVSGTSEVEGQETVEVTFEGADKTEGIAHVAAEEPHYVLRYDLGDKGDLNFSEFDEPVEPEAPASDEVVDLSKLGA